MARTVTVKPMPVEAKARAAPVLTSTKACCQAADTCGVTVTLFEAWWPRRVTPASNRRHPSRRPNQLNHAGKREILAVGDEAERPY